MNPGKTVNDDRRAIPAAELERVNLRRKRLYGRPLDAGERPWGLALSGGGIRSATFALGVLQALARPRGGGNDAAVAPLLARFDYLSTVSGGGYIGAFLGALYRPAAARGADGRPVDDEAACRQAAQAAWQCLATDPPGRITADTGPGTVDHPLRWLRENGRYMAPGGAGDLVYAVCLQLRNWCAVHYVIGITLMALFMAGIVVRMGLLALPGGAGALFETLEVAMQPGIGATIWWSPWFALALLALVCWALPCGVAYWLTHRPGPAAPRWQRILFGPVSASVLLAASIAALAAFDSTRTTSVVFLGATFGLVAVIAFAIVAFWWSGGVHVPVTGQRVTLTRWLTAGVAAAGCVALLALAESCAQSAYLALHRMQQGHLPTLSAAGAALAAAFSAIRGIAQGASAGEGWAGRIPSSIVFSALATLLLFTLASLWGVMTLTLASAGHPVGATPGDGQAFLALALDRAGAPHLALACLAIAVAMVAAGYFVGFINLSSLATLYAARLTRAYLGASNVARFGGDVAAAEVAEPHPRDDFRMSAYHDTAHLGPLHLINVTINATTGGLDRLTQMDRKGLPLAVTPDGLSVNGEHAERFGDDLTLGQWVGVSGAAFAPGIGRGTNAGLATVCTLANVRLGYWWNSGRLRTTIAERLRALVRNQRYLLREMRGRFFGTRRHFWYLSDGGHFENTAAYELLRRRCAVVVVCDDGADPDYAFEDLANLMRLARIDLGADFTLIAPDDAPAHFATAGLALGTDAKSRLATSPAVLDRERGKGRECALAYRVSYRANPDQPTLLLVIKPRLTEDTPLDVRQYQSGHTAFPQESTLDQFFDEAQWESYRKLGACEGRWLFGN